MITSTNLISKILDNVTPADLVYKYLLNNLTLDLFKFKEELSKESVISFLYMNGVYSKELDLAIKKFLTNSNLTELTEEK